MNFNRLYMETKIQKWGNSLAVRLPKAITKKFAFRKGSSVIVTEEHKRIIIEPRVRIQVSLRDMVRHITSQNIHDEAPWGDAHGREVW